MYLLTKKRPNCRAFLKRSFLYVALPSVWAFLLLIFATTINPCPAWGQGISKRDVLVVFNGESQISRSAAYYYLFSRELSFEMLLELHVPLESPNLDIRSDEDISRTNYNTLIRDPVAARLASLGQDAPSTIVLILGIPLRIADDSGGNVLLSDSTGASVDAELAVLGSALEGSAGIFTSANPYFGSLMSFEAWRASNPDSPLRYLVTRIAGYQDDRDQYGLPAAIRMLVDRAQLPRDLSGLWVVDEDGTNSSIRRPVDMRLLRPATGLLRFLGLPIIHDITTAIIKDVPSVTAYASWGSNDTNSPNAPYYGVLAGGIYPGTFAPRSIATTIVSTNARSFVAPPIYGQSLVADLIQIGAAGVAGSVSEPGAFQLPYPQVLFTHYAIGATAAEAYYSSLPYLGWMNVWVGDPLMRLFDPDADEDGVADRLDECVRSLAETEVDHNGCSQSQFCAEFDPGADAAENLILACEGADWLSDEPALREPEDCEVKGRNKTLVCEKR